MRSISIPLLAFLLCACTQTRSGIIESKTDIPELANKWWQWAFSATDAESPVRDETGKNCSFAQRGEIWFLAGGYGSSHIARECHVPLGKKLFFPVVNMVFYPRVPENSYTCSEAMADASLNNETAYDLFAELDGAPTPRTNIVRARSTQCFDIFAMLPSHNKPYAAYPSATDGFWVLLDPLPSGRHVLKFGGRYSNAGVPFGKMAQDIEYVLYIGATEAP